MNHCLAWRTRRLAQRTGHAKSSIVLPHRGELKIPFFPKSQINKVLEDFQIGKENCYHQLSIKTDWWVVFWSRSLYLASDPDKEMTAGVYIENASTSEQVAQISITVLSEAGITVVPGYQLPQ